MKFKNFLSVFWLIFLIPIISFGQMKDMVPLSYDKNIPYNHADILDKELKVQLWQIRIFNINKKIDNLNFSFDLAFNAGNYDISSSMINNTGELSSASWNINLNLVDFKFSEHVNDYKLVPFFSHRTIKSPNQKRLIKNLQKKDVIKSDYMVEVASEGVGLKIKNADWWVQPDAECHDCGLKNYFDEDFTMNLVKGNVWRIFEIVDVDLDSDGKDDLQMHIYFDLKLLD